MAWALYGILFHMDRFTVRAGLISGGGVLARLRADDDRGQQRLCRPQGDADGDRQPAWLGALLIIGAIVGWFGA